MKSSLDLDLARTFETIAESGSFSRAADLLSISVPTVSLRMKRLEEVLGQELFFKDGRGKELTDAGRAFLVSARKLLQINDFIFLEAKTQGFEGRIRIGATEDFAEDRLPNLLREFSLRNPSVRVDLTIDVNRRLHAALSAGDLDIALIAQDPFAPKEGKPLFDEQLVWIATEDFDLRSDAPLPLILVTEPCIVRSLVLRAVEERHIEYNVVCTSPSLAGIRAAIRAGLGITARTRAQIEPGLKELRASRLLPALPSLQLCVFMRSKVVSNDTLLLHMKDLLARSFSGARFNRVASG